MGNSKDIYWKRNKWKMQPFGRSLEPCVDKDDPGKLYDEQASVMEF